MKTLAQRARWPVRQVVLLPAMLHEGQFGQRMYLLVSPASRIP